MLPEMSFQLVRIVNGIVMRSDQERFISCENNIYKTLEPVNW